MKEPLAGRPVCQSLSLAGRDNESYNEISYMEEFQISENTLAKWTIRKNYYQLISSLIFLVPLAIFLVGFIGVYFVLKSTNIAFLIVPILLFLPVIPGFTEFYSIMKIYKENLEVYITEKGVYVRHLDLGDKYSFIDWFSIKQFDITTFPKDSFIGKMIPKPTRFVLRGAVENEAMTVDALEENADVFKNLLQERDIPFGFKTD